MHTRRPGDTLQSSYVASDTRRCNINDGTTTNLLEKANFLDCQCLIINFAIVDVLVHMEENPAAVFVRDRLKQKFLVLWII